MAVTDDTMCHHIGCYLVRGTMQITLITTIILFIHTSMHPKWDTLWRLSQKGSFREVSITNSHVDWVSRTWLKSIIQNNEIFKLQRGHLSSTIGNFSSTKSYYLYNPNIVYYMRCTLYADY